jgi:TetR/AcrR family transcriptional regulator, transcriptional repressor for nem operon
MARASVRSQLVDAALEQFHQRGYNGCGVKDITDAAGVPKGSFYNHFESKEAMALEALRAYSDQRRSDLLTDSGRLPLERLRSHFEFLATGFEAASFTHGCMYGNFANEMGDHSPALRAAVAERLDRWSERVAGLIDEARADGQRVAPGADATVLGRFIVNTWQGAMLRARVSKDRGPVDEFFTTIFDTLLAG